MSPIEVDVDVRSVNGVIDERDNCSDDEGKKLSPVKKVGEWDEKVVPSLQLLSASPNRPSSFRVQCVPSVFYSTPFPTTCYPHRELSYTYPRVICSSPQAHLFLCYFPTADSHLKIQRIPSIYHIQTQSCIQCPVLQVMTNISIASSTSLVTCFAARHSFACA